MLIIIIIVIIIIGSIDTNCIYICRSPFISTLGTSQWSMRSRDEPREDIQQNDYGSESQSPPPNIELDFANNTSLHGLDRVADPNKPMWLRSLWLLGFIACFGVSFWQVIISIQDFLDYPANTVISVEYDSQLTFPAVTICNFNRYISFITCNHIFLLPTI